MSWQTSGKLPFSQIQISDGSICESGLSVHNSLGFDCKHAYAFNSLNKTELLPHILKGADYAVFSAGKALGLTVSVKPIVEGQKNWYILPEFSCEVGVYPSWGEDDCGHFYDEHKCSRQESLEWELFQSTRRPPRKEIILLVTVLNHSTKAYLESTRAFITKRPIYV